VTLEEFVGTITLDPSDPDETKLLPVREDAWPAKDESELLPGARYAIVQRLAASDEQVFQNGGSVEAVITQVRIYQKPNSGDSKPLRAPLRSIYRVLQQAPQHVNESPLGVLSGLTLSSPRLPVQADPDRPPGPEGLVGLVTFKELIEA
jgi:hypothetical protein